MAHVVTSSLVPGDLVFDIGAHVGNKSEWFLERGLEVICVEPQPAMIQILRDRFASNPSATVVGKGVGSARGILQMSIATRSPVLSTFAEHWKHGRFSDVQWDSRADVEIILLDDLIHQFGVPRYCKIDVEGYELEVIRGLSNRVGIISFEFTSEFMSQALLVTERLISLGYRRFNISLAESETYYFPQWIPYHELVSVLYASRDSAGLWGDVYAN